VTASGSSRCTASSCPEPGLRRRADRAEAQLAALRRRVHAHLAGAAYSGDLGTDVVNNILAAVDLPLLPRRWTVELTATVTCTVTAGTAEDAVDDAKELLDIAFEAMTHNSDFDVTAVVPALPVLPGDFVDPSDEPPAH
jgi:hypothetical protein